MLAQYSKGITSTTLYISASLYLLRNKYSPLGRAMNSPCFLLPSLFDFAFSTYLLSSSFTLQCAGIWPS